MKRERIQFVFSSYPILEPLFHFWILSPLRYLSWELCSLWCDVYQHKIAVVSRIYRNFHRVRVVWNLDETTKAGASAILVLCIYDSRYKNVVKFDIKYAIASPFVRVLCKCTYIRTRFAKYVVHTVLNNVPLALLHFSYYLLLSAGGLAHTIYDNYILYKNYLQILRHMLRVSKPHQHTTFISNTVPIVNTYCTRRTLETFHE